MCNKATGELIIDLYLHEVDALFLPRESVHLMLAVSEAHVDDVAVTFVVLVVSAFR